MLMDRRGTERMDLVRPAKILNCRSRKFIAAETCNLSQSGVLVKIDRSHPVSHGDELEVAIDWGRSPGLLGSEELVTGRVVRVASMDYVSQSVALQFARRGAMVSAA
ncbi:MAG: PilZ domain-containing protein [Phycisphaerales bacterium]|nr:PilZ domain-containing protein [Phycisphaerales bacterium]